MAVSEIEYESFNACIEGKNIQVNPGFINAQCGSELISPENDALGAWEVIFTLNQAHVDNSLSSIRNIIKMISVPVTIILENTKNIPAEAFMGCKSVKYVYVNDTDSENAEQRKIGKDAFSECGIIKTGSPQVLDLSALVDFFVTNLSLVHFHQFNCSF